MLTNKQKAEEIIKCRQNPFYFFYNYVYIPETGTGDKIKITYENLHPKMRRVVRTLYRYNKCVLMASRQLGKSSIAACMIAWATVFYPGIKVIILNMRKNAGLQNIATVKFIIKNLPSWMVTSKPFKSRSEIVSYVVLFNDSRIDVFYPSTTHSANTLARSLTAPILYIDESAFIRDMDIIYGAAQPVLSKAREQALSKGYPTFQLITSTPNGVAGDGEWFYNRWQNAVDSDLIFDNDVWKKDIDIDKIVSDPEKNTFVRVRYHWSEDPTKDDEWYREQCQDLSQRQINQELDLLFVGTKDCVFSDETLACLKSEKPSSNLVTKNSAVLNIFQEELDPNDYYLIGCDTAESLDGAFCAIQVFSFKEFNQIAELQHRYGSYTAFGQDIDYIFRYFYERVGNNIILCNECNTIGKAPIEYLLYQIDDIDYLNYIYMDKSTTNDLVNLGIKKQKGSLQNFGDRVGILTTGLTKPLMVGCLVQFINENKSCIKSQNLINQLSNIERTNSGSIKSNGFSDLFMAACFCAYVRNKKAIDILPLIDRQDNLIDTERTKLLYNIANVYSVKNISKKETPNISLGDFNISDPDDEEVELEYIDFIKSFSDNSSRSSFLPFFSE